jgi:hypothetical protein
MMERSFCAIRALEVRNVEGRLHVGASLGAMTNGTLPPPYDPCGPGGRKSALT